MKNIFNNRRFKHGSLATVIAIGFLVLVIVINVAATLLLERYPLTIDLTSDNRFQLTDESIAYIEDLDKDIKITVCADENEFKNASELYKQAYEIIKSYEKYNKKIKLEFVDLQKNPTFGQKYPNETLQIADIIVESDLRVRKVSQTELFEAQQTSYGGVAYSSKAEQVMTGAIMYATTEKQTKVVALGGMGNGDISQLTSVIKQNNFEVTEANLLTEEIDQAADMVILPSPETDLSAAEVKKLEAYLDNDGKFGKSLLFISDYQRVVGPVLKNFLAEWGIEVEPAVIMETNAANVVYNSPYVMISKIVDSDIANSLKTTSLPFVAANASPVKVLFEERDNRKTGIIAMTSDTTVSVPLDAEGEVDINALEKSAKNVLVKGTREKYVGSELVTSSVVAFGSNEMMTPDFLLNAAFNNANVIVSTTNILTDKQDDVKILPVQFADQVITITQAQVTTYRVIFVIIIPILIVAASFIIWFRRRHL